jgi:flagellar basal-body rod protein FlgG
LIRSLWVAKTGLEAQQLNVDVISNNLANVSTNGFKRQRPVFEDLLYQQVRQPGAQTSQQTQVPSGLQIGTGVRPAARCATSPTAACNRPEIRSTSRSTVRASSDPAPRRYHGLHARRLVPARQQRPDGHLQRLHAAAGHHHSAQYANHNDRCRRYGVGDAGGQLRADSARHHQLANFINPAGLQARGENLFLETAASGPPQLDTPGLNGLGPLNQGFVETSNVSVTEELVNLITAQRAFEINSRAIETSDQMLQKLTQL